MMHKVIQPEGWKQPKGYANGIEARGRLLFVGGQVGWNAQEQFESDDLVAQVRQALQNCVAIIRAAGGQPEHIGRMTWYLRDKREYNARLKEIGAVYREVVGRHFPAMSAVQVADFVEDGAKVEIEVTAVLPD
jgi:enamine deaminase RidA (YjgF/YER057c/UK114 family)